MTALIDYDAGNMRSVEKALRSLGDTPLITRDREELLSADRVILPGVGAYRDCMEKLRSYGLTDIIPEIISAGKPFLGICLGMQLLFDSSEEGMEENGGKPVQGLGILKGKILKIPASDGRKIPHMGWNSITVRPGSRLFSGVENGAFVYFVHSYYLKAEDESAVAATTEYGVSIHAAVEKGNLFGCQFHPEKSSETGLKILKNFLGV
jgi:glutamine amidotransferase